MISNCENCKFRAYAERKPDPIVARLWSGIGARHLESPRKER
jgi:hypothetical protein